MEKRIFVTALLIALLSVVFSMSGDGENVPVKQKQKSEAVQVQNEQLQQEKKEVQNKSNSVNTKEMLEKEEKELFAQFEYFKPLGLPSLDEVKLHYESFKEKYAKIGLNPYGKIPLLYKNRVNLDAISKFKKIGIDLYELDKENYVGLHGLPLKPSILLSPVIISGTVVDSINYPYYGEPFHDCYTVKVDKFFKGNDYFQKIPEYIHIFLNYGKSKDKDGNFPVPIFPIKKRGFVINKSYIFLLANTGNSRNYTLYQQSISETNNKELSEKREFLKKLIEPTSFRIIKTVEFDSLKSFEKTIKEIEKINDTKSFFKREIK